MGVRDQTFSKRLFFGWISRWSRVLRPRLRFRVLAREIWLVWVCHEQYVLGKTLAEILNPTFGTDSVARKASDYDLLVVVISIV
jgi:hypothetical protein